MKAASIALHGSRGLRRAQTTGPHLIRVLDFDHPAPALETGLVHVVPLRDAHERPLRDGDLTELGRAAYVRRDRVRMPDSRRGTQRSLHPAFANTLDHLARLAPSDVPIIVTGETGTGKELTARAIHDASGRPGRFVPVNCGALPASLIESELFGCIRGAFSGADVDRPGLVRAAHGGTLFLDEIAELSLPSQVALLRVLQEGEVRPVGADRTRPVDVRVICATHQDLGERVARGAFREDLYARLAGYTASIPPLRARLEDLGVIVAGVLRRIAPDRAAELRFTPRAGRALIAHEWPRNVRELEHALRTAVALAGDNEIDVEHLPPAVQAAAMPDRVSADARERDRCDRVRAAIADAAGNVTAAAHALGYSRAHLHRLLRTYGIRAADYRCPTRQR